MAAKRRLDVLLVQRGLAQSQEKARTAILAGDVLVDGAPALRGGGTVPAGARDAAAPPPR